MKTILSYLILLAFMVNASLVAAQPIMGTTTFDSGVNTNIAPYGLLPRSGSVQGWNFFINGAGSGSINHNGANIPSTVNFFVGTATTINIGSDDGSEFDLKNFVVQFYNFSGQFTITAYRDGASVGSLMATAFSSPSMIDFSSIPGFENIDEVRLSGFSGSDVTLNLYEITIGPPPTTSDCIAPLNFNNWSQEGDLNNGNWILSPDGYSLQQNNNSQGTFYVSEKNYFNTTVEGEFGVQTSNDDDFIGFVLGYQKTGAVNDFDMILFDWKQTSQSTQNCNAPAGMRLSRIVGTSPDYQTFWCSEGDIRTPLGLNTIFGGWEDFRMYKFKVSYGQSNIKIWIDDLLVFDVEGNFKSGKFGFFNLSQENTIYRSFSVPFSAVINKTDVSCPGKNDGNAIAVPSESAPPPYQFSWSNGSNSNSIENLSPGNYQVTITAANGCATTQSVVIDEIADTIPPEAVAKDITVELDENGNASITPDLLDNGSSDNCTPPGDLILSLDRTTFTCADVGDYSAILTVTDNKGNQSTATAVITIEDKIAPNITCPSNIEVKNDPGSSGAIVYFPPSGYYTATDHGSNLARIDLENGNSTVLGSFSFPNTHTIAFTPDNKAWTLISSNQLASVDLSTGNATPIGNPFPFMSLGLASDSDGQLFTLGNDQNLYKVSAIDGKTELVGNTGLGQVMDIAFDNDDKLWVINSTHNLYSVSTVDGSSKQETVISSEINNEMGLAIDDSGVFYLTEYTSNPRLFELNPVSGSLTLLNNLFLNYPHGGDIVNSFSFSDNCSAITITQISGLPSGSEFPIGTTTNTFEVTDSSGNKTTCSFNVTVSDLEAPKDYTVNIDQSEIDENNETSVSFTFTNAEIGTTYNYTFNSDNGGTEVTGSGTITTVSEQITGLDLSGLEDGTVTLLVTLTDASSNEGIATTDSVLKDTNDAPVAVCKAFTAELNADGTVSFTAADVDGGSTDDKAGFTVAIDTNTFNCSNIGDNQVELTITDSDGVQDSCLATVTVEDNIAPVVATKNITVELDENGEASIVPADINDGSTDNCAIDTYSLDIVSFTCTDVNSPVTVTLTLKDVNGNSASETAIVTVEDNVAPVVSTKNITVELDADGETSIAPADINDGSTDNCAIDTYSLDIDSFTCADVNSPVTVSLTVKDVNGNSASETAVVTVKDNIAPEVATKDITVQLDVNGEASIIPADINDGSTDNCAIETYSLDIDSFTCADVDSPVTVTLTVKDVNGNSASETGVVTVQDNIAPEVATKDITVQLDVNGEASIIPADINDGSTDNCAIETYSLDIDSFTCADVDSPVTVTLTVKDVNGNSASGTATVTVEDKVAPVVGTKNITVQLDKNGMASIVPADINNGSTDNCAINTYSLDIDSFTCADVDSPVTVTLTVKDVNGNSASETAVVTVEDNVAPIVSTKNITVELDASGEASIVPADINDGSTDNCAIDTYTLDIDSFTCADVNSPVTVTLTVKDVNGNSASETATVTVKDNIDPVVVAKDFSIQLNDEGKASITVDDVVESVSDNCAVENISLSQYDFDCSSDNTNQVVVTVTDAYGNSATAEVTISVLDEIAPVVITKDIVVELDENGSVSITPEMVLDESYDNCGIASMDLDLNSFTCNEAGINIVVLSVTDQSGNTGTAEAIVEVVNSFGDNDSDGLQDNCDDDDDNDGVPDEEDNSPYHYNPDQLDTDGDGEGDVSDPDDDNDGVMDEDDNCPLTYNPDQSDINKDGLGDVCDTVKILASEGLTPNGDGINDTWRIINIENHPNAIVQVYNRWGKKVFLARGYRNDWNGQYEGNELPEGSYYYQVDLNADGIPEQTGWLYLTK